MSSCQVVWCNIFVQFSLLTLLNLWPLLNDFAFQYLCTHMSDDLNLLAWWFTPMYPIVHISDSLRLRNLLPCSVNDFCYSPCPHCGFLHAMVSILRM